MIKFFKDLYWKNQLKNYQCKLAPGVSSLKKDGRLDLEPHVRIGQVKLEGRDISIGAYTYIRSGSELNGNCRVGRFCSLGQNVIVGLEKDMHPMDWLTTSLFCGELENAYQRNYLPTTIGNDCWIGRDAIVMSGVTIGNGAIIGARALVTKDVPAYAVVVGSPARVIKYRFSKNLIEKLQRSQWWNLNINYLAGLNMSKPEACLASLDEVAQASYPKLRLTRGGIFLGPFED
jgi:acetyltransferase-like isoleucine patch superfamily enzyme